MGIWVFAEQRQGQLSRVSIELLGQGQILAEKIGQELCAVLLGHSVSHLSNELKAFGSQKIYLAEHELLGQYQTNTYASVIEKFLQEYKPNIFLIGATTMGRDLAPRLAIRLGLGLTADCTELSIDPACGSLLQTRPAFGGNIMATIKTPYSRPQMATVRPGVMLPKEADPTLECRLVEMKVKLKEEDAAVRILEKISEKKERPNLSDSKIIVAGGRGVGSEEGMEHLRDLADALGGEVAGTRVVVENGWLPAERQIGQTGQTVRPDLYVACGISGAIQHRAGILGSKHIIAINKDERAPIFEVADLGIVGDVHALVPALTKAVRLRRGDI